jgi:cbb3-type cytochrome oxidase maturation protein
MIILLLLIAVSLSIALVFLIAFVWSVRSGQYDDTYTPSVRILFENQVTRCDTRGDKRILRQDASPKKDEGSRKDFSKPAPGKRCNPDGNS